MRLSEFTVCVLALLATTTFAAQPTRFNYQAKLTSSTGEPLNGSHPITVSIWLGGTANAADTGYNIFAETASVTATNGVVNHAIGSGTPTSGTLNALSLAPSADYFVQVAVDTPTNVILPRTRLESVPFAARADCAPASLFSTFGGNGQDGDLVYNSGPPAPATPHRVQYNNLTIPAGQTYYVPANSGYLYMGVRGTCTIHGIIDGTGAGSFGGLGNVGPGGTGTDATGQDLSRIRVPGCISGAGGAGGGAAGQFGGSGGGAIAAGGQGGTAAGAAASASPYVSRHTGGAESGQGKTLLTGFENLLRFPGAGGGGGGGESSAFPGQGGSGGRGGGVVYTECNEFVFTGTIRARGQTGFTGFGLGGACGAGGGGGGGVVLVRARKITTNTGSVEVSGGLSGSPSGNGYVGGPGGAGYWDIVLIP